MGRDTAASKVAGLLERMYARRTFGIKLGLDPELAILAALGNPERSFVSIHVAGTNGKGSVCAMVESVLRAAGLRTGLYTSPHLVAFNERIRVDGACVTDEELVELCAAAEAAEAEAARGKEWRESTFFEFTTALAFEHFRRRKVQVAVVETGMGGRLDATNVVTPLLSVITPVSLEHMAYLGPDIATIAGEKAGIIKPGRPVVYGPMAEEAEQVIRRTAAARKAPAIAAAQVDVSRAGQSLDGQKVRISSSAADYGTVMLPLLGRHQLANAAMAIAALEEAARQLGIPLDPAVVKAGLGRARWPARCQVIGRDPVRILDGGHNPGAAEALAVTLKELLGKRPLGLVAGLCTDKDAAGFFRPFGRLAKRVWAVPIRTERSLPAEAVARAVGTVGLEAEPSTLDEALERSAAWAAANGGAVCIAGSLFLAGEVMERLPPYDWEGRAPAL